MQITDVSFYPSALTAFVAIIGALYLYNVWRVQENRMTSDLPFLFSLSFIGTAANMALHALPILFNMELTLSIFRFRSLAIGLTVIPMIGMVFNIWLPRHAKWHPRALLAIVVYWISVAALGPDEPTIILLTVPILLVFALALTATFAVTWKTGRLKEVRSDLLVVALIFAIIAQGAKVPMMLAGLDALTYFFTAIMITLIILGLVNPWRKV